MAIIDSDDALEPGDQGIVLGAIHISSAVDDPTVAGIKAPLNSIYYRANGEIYKKTGVLETDWTLDTSSGLSEAAHRLLAQLVHNVASTQYGEAVINASGFPSSFTIYTDSGKASKIREWLYTESNGLPSSIVENQYAANGTTIAETMTYNAFNYTDGYPSNYEGVLT